jgi:GH15 family glucan-1,4-alpha-glucosidase
MPRYDSGSHFGRLLDWHKGGFCSVRPAKEHTNFRQYVEGTLVLETTFRTGGGEVRVTDFFSMRRGGRRSPRREIVRIIEGTRGRVDMHVQVEPRFDYGEVRPWVRRRNISLFTAIGGDDGLVISCTESLQQVDRHGLEATVAVQGGEKVYLSIQFGRPEDLDSKALDAPTAEDLDRRLDETVKWWRRWSSRGRLDGWDTRAPLQSAIVLKGLTNAPTGAMIAAATTSLPETIGGGRNWDYRYSWIRDSSFALRALGELGFDAEADGFRRFVERSAAGNEQDLQIVYGPGGERRLVETEIEELGGYRRSKPVRVGNDAYTQQQHDVYGELLGLSWEWHERGRSPDDDYWRFLVDLVNGAADVWRRKDPGLWELRDAPQHFVHSKVMCWAALDLGIRLAKESSRRAPTGRWRKVRDEIRAAVESRGYDKRRGVFVRAFGTKDMDASLLLLPNVGFIDWQDDRMVRTADAVWKDLGEDDLIWRYRGPDGMEGEEGAFVACTFWLAECLARQGRSEEARRVFDRAVATANDLGLFSEEFDPKRGIMLGNFPQGLSHLSHISAAVALAQAQPE